MTQTRTPERRTASYTYISRVFERPHILNDPRADGSPRHCAIARLRRYARGSIPGKELLVMVLLLEATRLAG